MFHHPENFLTYCQIPKVKQKKYRQLGGTGYSLKNDKKMAMALAQKAVDIATGEFREAIKKDLEKYSRM